MLLSGERSRGKDKTGEERRQENTREERRQEMTGEDGQRGAEKGDQTRRGYLRQLMRSTIMQTVQSGKWKRNKLEPIG